MTPPARLHKYVDPMGLRAALVELRLRWSRPARFNDPFDTQFELQFPFTDVEFDDRYVRELKALTFDSSRSVEANDNPLVQFLRRRREQGLLGSAEQLAREARAVLREARQPMAEPIREWSAQWRDTIRSFLVLSLSEEPDNPVMWAHYGWQNRGAVLQFVADAPGFPQFYEARPVEYRERPPAVVDLEEWVLFRTNQRQIDGERLARKYVFTKGLAWRYEREWRNITRSESEIRSDGFEEIPFPPFALVTVVFGCKMSEEERDRHIRSISAMLDRVVLEQAAPDRTEFRIVTERLGVVGDLRQR